MAHLLANLTFINHTIKFNVYTNFTMAIIKCMIFIAETRRIVGLSILTLGGFYFGMRSSKVITAAPMPLHIVPDLN